MPRSTILVGNGIGLALDAHYFSLRTGLSEVWNNTDHLTAAHKNLILSAIEGTSENNPPQSEDQLDILHFAIIATEFLCNLEVSGDSWVSDAAEQLPSAFRKYIHEVARYFHRSQIPLPFDFVTSLASFIRDTKSHLATLNYDNLLYDALIESGILDGYDGSLIDGFRRNGFSEQNMDRHNPERLGWYLHLHGSPLYIENEKMMGQAARSFLEPSDECHIVLNHVTHKPAIISASRILSEYWRRFAKALDESSKIYIFGYSGLDPHVNNMIQQYKSEKELCIVEWEGAGELRERRQFWKSATCHAEIELVRLENILDFCNWDEY